MREFFSGKEVRVPFLLQIKITPKFFFSCQRIFCIFSSFKIRSIGVFMCVLDMKQPSGFDSDVLYF